MYVSGKGLREKENQKQSYWRFGIEFPIAIYF